jgi:hypothetical protein
MPSLAQLDQAVREFLAENPNDIVTVVVDASFGHRIDPSELPTFEEAESAGEVVSPPAGAIGRGDAFLLRIAEKMGATVLSNDSFQEFHGEHAWLFDKGRLIGGKPVPGVGWIFMDRTPVRGHKSREVVKEAKRRKRAEIEETAVGASNVDGKGSEARAPELTKPKARSKAVDRAIARATQEVVEPKASGKSRRRRSGQPPADPVNEPLAFITFIAAHPLGSEVVGSVIEFSSHGAFVDADGARCYVPLSAMGNPAPRRAREVVAKGETRTFTVQAFDPQRRGIELALPEFARVAGEPTPETVEAEIHLEAPKAGRAKGKASARTDGAAEPEEIKPAKKPAKKAAAQRPAPVAAVEPEPAVPNLAPAAKKAAKRATAKKVAPPDQVGPAGSGEAPAEPTEKVPARKAPARKAAAKKAAPKKASAPAKKAPAPAKAVEKGAAKEAPATKVPAKKVPAKKAAAKTATAKKAASRRAAAAKTSAKKVAEPDTAAE